MAKSNDEVKVVNKAVKAKGVLKSTNEKGKALMFGVSVVRVLRALGRLGWKHKMTRKAFDTLGFDHVKSGTIKKQLFYGQHPESYDVKNGGEVTLTKEQLKTLKDAGAPTEEEKSEERPASEKPVVTKKKAGKKKKVKKAKAEPVLAETAA